MRFAAAIPGLSLATSLMFAWTLPTSAGNGGHEHEAEGSACERTAESMHRACLFEVGDELFTTLANCRNLATREERRACDEDARTARQEEAEHCGDVFEARADVCERLGENRYAIEPLLDPANVFVDPNDIPGVYARNPFVSLAAGHTYVLRAGDEGEETVVVHVTDESRDILGVQCRVVVDAVVEVASESGQEEYEAVEVTDDWFAQDTLGNVYYCGEISRNYEDGILRDLDGSFEAGIDYARAGTLIRANPAAGGAHRQEFLLGEAEDVVEYQNIATAPRDESGGDNPKFPCAPDGCLETLELTPLEPEASELKYYLPGTGFVLAVAMEDGEVTGEREELVCVGDSLDILGQPACEIADVDALVEALCSLAPHVFCEN